MTKKEDAGKYPFTRGIHPRMYQEKLWTIRQYAGFGSIKDTNTRFRYYLKEGMTGLSVAFDLPTQIGYDSDHAMAVGEVGRVGVPVCTLEDMDLLFRNIQLGRVSTSMTINATAAILLAFYVTIAKKRNVPLHQLQGTIQNDILKEYIARGTYIYPPTPSMRLVTDIFEWCGKNAPKWNTISISGYHIREAGATAVQELAFTFANAIVYLEWAKKRGLKIDEIAPRISFFFNAHLNFFEEIAKFRAARRIWAKIMKTRFKAVLLKSQMCRFHVQTAGSTLTAQQVNNNVIRTTIEALAAVLGGTQSLHTNARDEALALPTEESAKLALRTQQIIANESGVANAIDPLGGSYFVEKRTSEIEKDVFSLLKKIDKMGGAVNAIESRYIQNEIARSAFAYQKEIEKKERIIVGVNEFVSKVDRPTQTLVINRKNVREQLKRLKEFKKNRDTEKVAEALEKLQKAIGSSANLFPFILEAVEKQATLGEISDRLRNVFGEYHEN